MFPILRIQASFGLHSCVEFLFRVHQRCYFQTCDLHIVIIVVIYNIQTYDLHFCD